MQFLLLGTLVIILLAFSAFFAASELSILKLRASRVKSLIEESQPGAQSIQRLQRRLRRTLIIAQLGITSSLVSLGWISQKLASNSWKESNLSSFWDLLLLICIIILSTFLSGFIPKALVLNRPERAGLLLAPILEVVLKIMGIIISLLEKSGSFLLKLVGLNTKWDSPVSALSAGELETIIESGGVTGLRPDERNILEGVFALRDTHVREVMVPRSGMVTLPKKVKFAELMKEVHETHHARFLVTDESLDDVLGIIDLRQLAEPISRGTLEANSKLEPYIKEVPRVLETSTLAEILPLIKGGNPLLLVIDEHGGTEGLITAADLIGEIVGDEIQSENEESSDLLSIDGNPKHWLAAGDLEIIELNRQLEIDLPEADDHHTLAGFLLEKLQQVPSTGETLHYRQIKFEIMSMKGPRIDRVRIILFRKPPQNDP